MKRALFATVAMVCVAAVAASAQRSTPSLGQVLHGKRLFERETFGGNGRTCRTCHTEATGTLSPADVKKRFDKNPLDALFLHDGSDDGQGQGTTRMLKDATVLVTIPLAANVSLADDPTARTVTLRRGIPSTLNSPALDPVIMLDGRQPTLEDQAAGAIADHALGVVPSAADLRAIAAFEKTIGFFSSADVFLHARTGRAMELPRGRTASERRGRRFFEDVPPDPAQGLKPGLCAHCHSGPLLNMTNEFAAAFIPAPAPIPQGQRFISVGVSEFNDALNEVRGTSSTPAPRTKCGCPARIRAVRWSPGLPTTRRWST